MNSNFIISQTDVENSKTMLAHTYYKPISLLAYNEHHCELLQMLTPLIAAPWFLGSMLFVRSQWIPTLIINDIPVTNYEIQPSRNMYKACKYHANVIKSIYEVIKELYVIGKRDYCYNSLYYFNNIPAWIGLIINDVVTYIVHTICVNECLNLNDIKIYNSNIKENLINKQKNIFKSPVISSQAHNFKYPNQIYETYDALNSFIKLSKHYSDINENFNELYYKPFENSYQKYLQSLKAKWWKVTLIDQTGNVYMHKNNGRLPNNRSKETYNQILFID